MFVILPGILTVHNDGDNRIAHGIFKVVMNPLEVLKEVAAGKHRILPTLIDKTNRIG